MIVCALTQLAQESIVTARAVHCDIEKCISKVGRIRRGMVYSI